jgi:branched-chain amino acid transport system substrate-binding protein
MGRIQRRRTACAAVVISLATVASACGSSHSSSSATTSSTPTTSAPASATTGSQASPATPIKVGMITALSGPLSAERSNDVRTVQALIKSVNASGGISGHQLTLLVEDDSSSPAGALTASQVLVSKGVVGIDFDDAVVEGGPAQYLASHQIPTTGLGDSPSWIQDANMFGVDGYSGGNIPPTTTTGVIEKSFGVSKIAGIAYGTIPPSLESVQGALKGATQVGVQSAGAVSIALSGNNFTATALQLKGEGVQGIYTATAANDNVSLGTALEQQGLHLPGILFATGYETSTLQSASTLQGTYWTSPTAPFDSSFAGATAYRSLLNQYAPGIFGGSQETFAYLGADLLVAGLKADGGSSSRSDLLKGISSITDFTAGGLLAQPVDFSKPKTSQNSGICAYVVKIQGSAFVQVGDKPFCGTVIGG